MDESKIAGSYAIRWDGLDGAGRCLASGVYFVRMEAGSYDAVRKILLFK